MLSFQDASALSITGLAQVFLQVAQQDDFMDDAAVARCNTVGFVNCELSVWGKYHVK